jgi:flagellar capping protein FliD
MLAESSDKDSFTATANRKAQRGRRRVQVLQLATPHTLLSDSLPKDKRFSGSVFTVKMDKKEVRIDFSDGGTLKELADNAGEAAEGHGPGRFLPLTPLIRGS